MRTVLRCAALAVVMAAALACDSEQPLQGGAVEAVVALDTAAADIPESDIWEVWEDTDNDNVPDLRVRQFQPDGPLVFRCDDTGTTTLTRYPWGVAVEISVLRKGSVTPEIVTTTLGLEQRFSGMTRFGTDTPTAIPDAPPLVPFYFINGVRSSKANATYVDSCIQPNPPFVPNVGQLPNPATIALSPGDTLLVQARKATQVQNFILPGLFPNPLLTGAVFVGGAGVATNGTTQTTAADGDGMSFSYTLN